MARRGRTWGNGPPRSPFHDLRWGVRKDFPARNHQFRSVCSTNLSVHISSPRPNFRICPTWLGKISRRGFDSVWSLRLSLTREKFPATPRLSLGTRLISWQHRPRSHPPPGLAYGGHLGRGPEACDYLRRRHLGASPAACRTRASHGPAVFQKIDTRLLVQQHAPSVCARLQRMWLPVPEPRQCYGTPEAWQRLCTLWCRDSKGLTGAEDAGPCSFPYPTPRTSRTA